MELHAQERPRAVPHSLVRPIIGIREPWLPSLRQRIRVNGETVVLRSDETAPGSRLETGLVVAAMAEFELVRFRSRRKGSSWCPRQTPMIGRSRRMARSIFRMI